MLTSETCGNGTGSGIALVGMGWEWEKNVGTGREWNRENIPVQSSCFYIIGGDDDIGGGGGGSDSDGHGADDIGNKTGRTHCIVLCRTLSPTVHMPTSTTRATTCRKTRTTTNMMSMIPPYCQYTEMTRD